MIIICEFKGSTWTWRKNNKQNNEISIYYNNINGMRSKKKSLGIIVKNIKPDVVCLCETKLGSLKTVKNKMESYKFIGRCVKYGQGGVLIAAKRMPSRPS